MLTSDATPVIIILNNKVDTPYKEVYPRVAQQEYIMILYPRHHSFG